MVRNKHILICTDLDRTLIPNGQQDESASAHVQFRQFINRPEVTLAYVSGRNRQLLINAIRQYDLPWPDYAITDVGSTIYTIQDQQWQKWQTWHEEISPDWGTHTQHSLAELLSDITTLRLQEDSKQGKYKLSYYADAEIDTVNLFHELQIRFNNRGIRASLIWSIDETTHTGLLDILPESANKLHAIKFLMRELVIPAKQVVFAGDSGNDLEVLCSEIQSVLVANATDTIKQQALRLATDNHTIAQLYIAQGHFLDMNGNYSAGILEGVVHYFPETLHWLQLRN